MGMAGTVRPVAVRFQITIDCRDADAMSAFWSTALGYEVEPPPAGYLSWEDFLRANDIPLPPAGSISAIVDPDSTGPRILFLRVPEPKTTKNRVHLDIRTDRTDDGKLTKIRELVSAGAAEVRRVDEQGGWWMVMTDPEGNEFCVT
jgi:catechol 2,3-dioxygenase-like lactoylglutathione lyase family enzyme